PGPVVQLGLGGLVPAPAPGSGARGAALALLPGAALLPAIPVHGAGGPLLRLLVGDAALLVSFPDVLVLALVLVAPCPGHRTSSAAGCIGPAGSGRCKNRAP